MTEEFEYVMVESGQSPTLENNLLPNLVHLTTGEASYTNHQLKELGQTQVYLKLETDDKEKDNDR